MPHYKATISFTLDVEGDDTLDVIEQIKDWITDPVELPTNTEITEIREDK